MRYLSLFSGVGGGDLGLQHLVGMECTGYVEWNKYCCRVIAARIQDGLLSNAPIYGDIRAFNSEGFAASYTGLVDLVAGGFPCQPFSNAGKRKGADDERNMWPATIGTIRIIRPRYCFLENVPGLLTSGYFPQILQDLAESGYDARWRVLSAAEVGAPHKRDRLWIVADSERSGWNGRTGTQWATGRIESQNGSKHVAYADNAGLAQRESITSHDGKEFSSTERGSWWAVEPDVGRVATGIPARVDRLKALGNGQVPLVAATAWRLLSEGLTDANPLLSPENT